MGSTLTIVNDTSDIYSVKIGPDTNAAKVAGYVATATGIFLSFGAFTGIFGRVGFMLARTLINSVPFVIDTSIFIHAILAEEGYKTLIPGERYTSGWLTLSLWQQCHCIRTKQNGDFFVVEEIHMRPIFSGATNGSNNDHFIKWWVGQYGLETVSRYQISK